MTVPVLGPDDYLMMPGLVHVMRYRGFNDDNQRYWSVSCGSRWDEKSVDAWDVGWSPSLAEVFRHDLAYCRRCLSVNVLTDGLVALGWDPDVARRKVRRVDFHRPDRTRRERDAIADSFETLDQS